MTPPRIWKYFPVPGVPGTTLERLAFGGDPVAEGIRLAAIMRARPPGQRGLHINELGGGASPDELHWYTRHGGNPLAFGSAEGVYLHGSRGLSVNNSVVWCERFAASYGNNGGPPWDFVEANVEVWPGAFLNCDAPTTWDDVVRWRGIDPNWPKPQQVDAVQQWGAETASRHIAECLNAIAPYSSCVKVNNQSIAFSSDIRKRHGQKVESATPCGVSLPQLYLTESYEGRPKTPESVLVYSMAVWDSIPGEKVCCVPAPRWGGTGDLPAVPGCTSKMFVANKGTPNEWRAKFWLKNLNTWADEYKAFIRHVATGRTDVVIWHNEGKFYGLAPDAVECRVMSEAFAEVGA